MRFLHTMVRVRDLERSLEFYCNKLGLVETRRVENESARFTLIFLAAAEDEAQAATTWSPLLELTYNWDSEPEFDETRKFGHLAYQVDDIHVFCQSLVDNGVTINRPPRDGRMAFIRSPDGISIELLQKGNALEPAEPWVSMENIGHW